MSMWHSGSPGAALMRLNFEQLREAMISGGYITEEEIARDSERQSELYPGTSESVPLPNRAR
jgi:hypothetical protein